MKTWLFNPFERVAGWAALIAGLAILFLTALTAYYGNIHLDGVLDLHVTEGLTLTTCLLEGLINWLSLSAFIYLAGLIFSRSVFRLVDVLGTQALARVPFFFSCLVSLLCFNADILHYFEHAFLGRGEAVTITAGDMALFAGMLLTTLAMTVWAVMLMYRAYSVSCNVKGTKAVLSFIGALLFAEIFSKLLIGFFVIE